MMSPATNGPPAVQMSVSVYHDQQHFAYLDASGNVQDAFWDGNSWHLQKINNGGTTQGPKAVGNLFVCAYQNQQHFAYLDASGNVQDAFYDGNSNSWHLQKINNGGTTHGPKAVGNLFVSVYKDQQHFAYLDASGNVQDAFWDGNSWHLQKINTGGTTQGPKAVGNLFVSAYQNQQHFAYLDASGNVQDAFYDGNSNSWRLQKINNGGTTHGPKAVGNLFVSVYMYKGPPIGPPVPLIELGDQQHFAYLDASGNVQDAFWDGNSWHLQKINTGGTTQGPKAVGNLFVSAYQNQQHFAYLDASGNVQDAFYDGNSNSWRLQKINNGGTTPGLPAVGQVFVSVYKDQQHFAYLDYRDVLQDAFWDGNSWHLQQLTTGLSAVTGSAPLDFVVMSVVYAPPGTSATGGGKSSVSYGDTSTLGTSSSVSSSFKEGLSVSADVSVLGGAVGGSASFSTSKDTTNTSEVDISKSTGFTIQVTGPAKDGIDHDQDKIYLILNPVVEISVTGKNVAWALSHSGTTAEVQFVTVGWLKNPSSMPAGVATSLRNAGIAPTDYPKLLARDPFASGASGIDTSRFLPTNTSFPYEDPTSSETYTITNDLTNKSSQSVTKTDSFSVTIKSGFDVGIVKESMSTTGSFTWTNTSTYGTTTDSKQQASATVGGPSSTWAGGTNVDVYYDTVYSSFLFAFDPNSVPSTREQKAVLKGTVTDKGKPAAHEEVLLTVGGQRYRTFTNSKGVYHFYNKPHGSGTVSIRGAAQPVKIGPAPVTDNREIVQGLRPTR